MAMLFPSVAYLHIHVHVKESLVARVHLHEILLTWAFHDNANYVSLAECDGCGPSTHPITTPATTPLRRRREDFAIRTEEKQESANPALPQSKGGRDGEIVHRCYDIIHHRHMHATSQDLASTCYAQAQVVVTYKNKSSPPPRR